MASTRRTPVCIRSCRASRRELHGARAFGSPPQVFDRFVGRTPWSAAGPLAGFPNAWDCVSARIVEEAGFPAIATTSAGVANALGYPDSEHIAAAEMLAAVARIARCVGVPVTADLEAGYQDIAATAAGLAASGAIGLNLEDAGGDPALHAARIATVRRIGRELG